MVNLLLVNEPLNPLSLVTLLEAEYTIDRSILVVSPTDRHSPEAYNDDGSHIQYTCTTASTTKVVIFVHNTCNSYIYTLCVNCEAQMHAK